MPRKGYKQTEEHKRKNREAKIGEKNPSWKGGMALGNYSKKTGKGYLLIYLPTHPHCIKSGHVYYHRYIMEKSLGRYLKPAEVIHHINNNSSDNRIENLLLFENKGMHSRYHNKLRKIPRLN